MEPDSVEIPFEVRSDEHGMRADLFLKRRLARLSRVTAQEIIEQGHLRRAGGEALSKPSARVFSGDRIFLRRRRIDEPSADDVELPIVHEDEDLLAVNKPGDLVVHPSATVFERSLIRIMRARYEGQYLTLAHRIDKETSGIVVLPRNTPADVRIKEDFALRRVKKSYLAIVVGCPAASEFVLDAPMRFVAESRSKCLMEIVASGGLPATTEVSVLAVGDRAALVEARPLTGRQHQIRLHLAHAGHPIIGDKLYLGDEDVFIRALNGVYSKDELVGLLGHGRQALHAHRIRLTHPRTSEELVITAPLAPDLVSLARRFGIQAGER